MGRGRKEAQARTEAYRREKFNRITGAMALNALAKHNFKKLLRQGIIVTEPEEAIKIESLV